MILLTVNVTVPLLIADVEVMLATPLELLTLLKPELTIAPVKFPVTVAFGTLAPLASLTVTVARALNLEPDATQLIVML